MSRRKKISELPDATTPLTGDDKIEVVQNGINKKVSGSSLGGTMTGSEILTAFGAQTATHFLGGPTPSFRAIADADIPAAIARLASPALTGAPTAPTAANGTNTTQIATTAFVQTAVSGSSGPSNATFAEALAGTNDTKYISPLKNAYVNGRVYNVKAYGAVGDAVTDDTVAIQTCIQAVFDAGGGVVFFPKGVYIIAGALQTAVSGQNPNSQLYIPPCDWKIAIVPSIKFLGESESIPWVDQTTTGAPERTSGVILKSTILGSGTKPRVIGCVGGLFSYAFNPCQISFENIAIHVRSKTGATHIAATVSAFGMRLASSVDFVNCAAHIESSMFDSVDQTTADVIGFECPTINNAANITLNGCVAVGFNIGYETSDHASINNCWVQHCRRGIFLANASQPIWLNQFLVYRCKYAFEFENGSTIQSLITGVVIIEDETDNTKWWFPTTTFFTSSSCTVNGTLNYYKGTDGTRSGTFGNLYLVNVKTSQKQVVFGGGSYPFVGGTGEWNGTSFEKPILELQGLASETGTGTQWPDFGMSFKQLAANGLVARPLVVYNRQKSGADKRIADFEMYTDTDINSGRYEQYVHDGTLMRLVLITSGNYFKVQRPVIIDSDISPTALAANTDNYAPTNIAIAATLRISASSAVDLTGIAGGATMVDGRELTVINVGTTNTITLKNDVTSTAANRFLLNADFALAANMACKLVYDGTSSRWRKIY